MHKPKSSTKSLTIFWIEELPDLFTGGEYIVHTQWKEHDKLQSQVDVHRYRDPVHRLLTIRRILEQAAGDFDNLDHVVQVTKEKMSQEPPAGEGPLETLSGEAGERPIDKDEPWIRRRRREP